MHHTIGETVYETFVKLISLELLECQNFKRNPIMELLKKYMQNTIIVRFGFNEKERERGGREKRIRYRENRQG